jgi:prevent-host-death family protein
MRLQWLQKGRAVMYSVGIRELKNRLSQYLRYARRGERVVITERGKAIAILQSLDDVEAPSTPELELARLARDGMIRLPRRKFAKKTPLVKISGPSVSSAVLEDRR